ncbi:uncharacterized protein F4812DRAFT_462088 [Daldinia caldariorum]|uniref:uncharacterized protein n=1 Tax=Daldinia caldariorum TaxID=326644 RepID=UPI00200842E6|nr:uncharacterized protein F4812DRAFT_462088 [Daldinia caldariorum]KAI1465243.1 hypothetical protein F4812DRAFT_462088 [Daldinia caldariorum]
MATRYFSMEESQKRHVILTELYNTSRDLYQALMGSIFEGKSKSGSLYRQFQNGYTRYIIWAHDYGAQDGELDNQLRSARRLRNLTIKVLIRIGSILVHVYGMHEPIKADSKLWDLCINVLAAMQRALYEFLLDFDRSDGESDTSDDEDLIVDGEGFDDHDELLQHATEELLTEIGYLSDMGPMFEEPIPDHATEEQPSISIYGTGDPMEYFVYKVMERFPKCGYELANTLGKANWNSTMSSVAKRQTVLDNPDSEATDLAIRTSLATRSHGDSHLPIGSDKATLLSYLDNVTNRAMIPPLTRGIGASQLFRCITCGKNLEKQGVKSWKRHLLADLQPWVCFQASCSCNSTFANREEWVEHLYRQQQDHPEWDDKTCPLCQAIIADGGRAALSHMARHLEEVSLALYVLHHFESSYDDDDGSAEIFELPRIEFKWN